MSFRSVLLNALKQFPWFLEKKYDASNNFLIINHFSKNLKKVYKGAEHAESFFLEDNGKRVAKYFHLRMEFDSLDQLTAEYSNLRDLFAETDFPEYRGIQDSSSKGIDSFTVEFTHNGIESFRADVVKNANNGVFMIMLKSSVPADTCFTRF